MFKEYCKALLTLLAVAATSAALGLVSSAALADEGEPTRVSVADPFLEMHTGAGRGYPIFHVVDRGETVELLRRRTDWFEVRAPRGAVGWVPRAQLERTLTTAGVPTRFRDVLLDDYLASRLLVVIEGGQLSDDPIVSLGLGWRFNQSFTVEGSYGRASGSFSRSELWQLALVSHPFPDWRWQPTWRLGIGRLDNTPQATLVGGTRSESALMTVGVGVERYLARRFLFRAGYSEHRALVDDDRADNHRSLTAGFAVFF